MKLHYPEISLSDLRNIDLIRRLLVEKPGYFDSEDCTYSPEFKAWFSKDAVKDAVPEAVKEVELASTEQEVTNVLKHLISLKNSLPNDTADQLQWVRAAATLLEKLVTLKEKAFNIKHIQEFEAQVIGILEDFLTPEQRTIFRERLADANLR